MVIHMTHIVRRTDRFRNSKIGSERKLNIFGRRKNNNLLSGLSLKAMEEDVGTT